MTITPITPRVRTREECQNLVQLSSTNQKPGSAANTPGATWKVSAPMPTKRTTPSDFWNSLDRSAGCWLWTRGTHKGYARVRYAGRNYRGHRLAWMLARGPIPDGLMVLHKCDVKNCCNPDHLYLGTHADNVRDAKERGRYPRHEFGTGAKLTRKQVQQIHALYHTGGITYRELGKQYGVHEDTIRRHIKGRIWKS